ncbi:TonB-dependent receptor plug domain-containing protein [Sphingobium nicotianae]|uniref:TonB-dependent receptor plug domain-containing protein n=1 Tax=Sphingobium nicotianae TaxID=2782607 RepID=A0A9X1IPA9_9SPHN|nr:TonB-dependent receptor plug domain-containing protein [Sphingobium nicotianae]MBT2186058.1 TonB-dependent receptor plug domain-containing protein [Sphingobium nicotianae]
MRTQSRLTKRNLLAGTAIFCSGLAFMSATAVAQELPDGGSGSAGVSQTAPQDGREDEIVVTAQRREQRVQDIPYNITAVSGEELDKRGALNLNDLPRAVPGLVTIDAGAATQGFKNNFVMRGLRTEDISSTLYGATLLSPTAAPVATYFGETFFTSPILLMDLARVEALRGPQGTLYGASSQGGTLRFLPRRPEFGRAEGWAEVGAGLTQESSDPNWNFKGAVNFPLGDKVAVRLVGGIVRSGGYIDSANLFARASFAKDALVVRSVTSDPLSGPVLQPVARDVNRSTQWQVRGAIRFAPTDNIDLQLGYIHQDTKVNDSPMANPGFPGGPFALSDGSPGYNPAQYPNADFVLRPGGTYTSTSFSRSPYRAKLDLASADATIDFGFATLTSATSYTETSVDSVQDLTGGFLTPELNYLFYYNYYPRLLAYNDTSIRSKTFQQEVRFVSDFDGPLNFVVGAFYQNEKIDAGYN